ncbi:MAG: hypothetical protein JW995_11995 [Melioribacteraceae bacterium]|nr:hypothetical protein [Melioribacteraceae bacterium]
MKKKVFTFFLLTLLNHSVFAQSINGSITLGSELIIAKYFQNYEYTTKPELYYPDFKLGIIFNIKPPAELEFRLGWSYGGENFTGFNLDMLFRHKIINEYLSLCGIANLHFNFGAGHGTSGISEATKSGLSFKPGLGIDYLLTKHLGVELFYLYSIDKDYGETIYWNIKTDEVFHYKKYLYHNFKVGFRYFIEF